MKLIFHPITTWPGELSSSRKLSPFRSPRSDTLELLDREVWHLGADVGKKAAGRELDGRTWDEMPGGAA